MGFFTRTFTWWHSQTWGTWWFTRQRGEAVGTDAQGNTYYRERGGRRRWVIYSGDVEASRVPPEWHGWLHHTVDTTPSERTSIIREWEKPHLANATGSSLAYFPPGSISAGGKREAATGDYDAWDPNAVTGADAGAPDKR